MMAVMPSHALPRQPGTLHSVQACSTPGTSSRRMQVGRVTGRSRKHSSRMAGRGTSAVLAHDGEARVKL